jgi:hypothetical protein
MANQYTNPWTDKMLDIITKRWLAGQTASTISEALQGEGITRNAVIGKLRRKGLLCNPEHGPLRAPAGQPKDGRSHNAPRDGFIPLYQTPSLPVVLWLSRPLP